MVACGRDAGMTTVVRKRHGVTAGRWRETTPEPRAAGSAPVSVPLVATVDACSWNALLTTSNRGHVLEVLISGLPVVGLLPIQAHRARPAQAPFVACIALGRAAASSRWAVTRRGGDWKSEIAWMSPLFSVAVGLGIGLIHAPIVQRDRGAGPAGPAVTGAAAR
jgi:hypothetical protein